MRPPESRTVKLLTKHMRSFIETQSSLGGLTPERRLSLGCLTMPILLGLDSHLDKALGKHGPGAVAEGYKSNQKWLAFLPHLVDLGDSLASIGYDLPYGLFEDRIREEGLATIKPSNTAKFVAVPKTYRSLRPITVEPMINQFVQQALNSHLRKEIERCSVMSQILTLNSQEPNQLLALEGSRTGDWVTVDLSSASDLLSTDLVKAVFANRPMFLRAALGCRTPTVKVGDALIDVKMYAGMGNATTFPIQSVCFAVLALRAATERWLYPSKKQLELAARKIRVFGDDIIVHKDLYPGLAEWIQACGLKINHSKSFTEGYFRESCGVDAYKGINVTPVYLRYDPSTIATDNNSFVGCVSTSNQLWLKGLYTTSDYLRKLLDRVRTLPLVSSDSQGLGYHTHQNYTHGHQRWNTGLHRLEIQTYVVVPTKETDRIDGYAALMKFFHSPRSAEYDRDHLSKSVRRFSINLRKRWVPA